MPRVPKKSTLSLGLSARVATTRGRFCRFWLKLVKPKEIRAAAEHRSTFLQSLRLITSKVLLRIFQVSLLTDAWEPPVIETEIL